MAPTLTSLDLADNQIGPEGLEELGSALAECCTRLLRLALGENPLTDDGGNFAGVGALSGALRAATELQCLDLSGAKLHSEGCLLVIEGLMAREHELSETCKSLFMASGRAALTPMERIAAEARAEESERVYRSYVESRPLKVCRLFPCACFLLGVWRCVCGSGRG